MQGQNWIPCRRMNWRISHLTRPLMRYVLGCLWFGFGFPSRHTLKRTSDVNDASEHVVKRIFESICRKGARAFGSACRYDPFSPIQDPPERRLAPSPPPHEGPESPSMDALRSSAALDCSISATSLTADGEESYFAEILCSKLGKFGV